MSNDHPDPPDAVRWIAALRSSHDGLVAAVAGLDDGQLARTSMSTEWTVADLLSHVGSGAVIGLATLEANVAGRDAPGNDANAAVWDRWNAMTPQEVAVNVGPADAALVEAFEALTPQQLVELRVRMPFLPEPIDVAATVGFRLSEHALHSWDLFATFDPAAEVAPDAAALLVDRLPMMVGFLGRFTPRATRPADPVTVAITTTDPTRHFELELGDALELRPADPSDGHGDRLTIPAEALVRLTSGRLGAGTAAGDIEPAGRLSLDDLRRAFPGF